MPFIQTRVGNYAKQICWKSSERLLRDWLFEQHINPTRVILCLKVKEWCILYAYIHIFSVIVSKENLRPVIEYQVFLSNTNIFIHTYLIWRWDPSRYYSRGQSGPANNSNKDVHHISQIFGNGVSPSNRVSCEN